MKLIHIKADKFIKNSSMLFVLLMCANLINFVYQIIIGRMITPADYGVVNSMFSLITVVSLPVTIFQYLIAKKYSEATVNNKFEDANELLSKCLSYCTIYSIIVVIISVFFYKKIAIVLNINNPYIVLLSLLGSIFFVYYPLINGLLQGLQLFVAYGIVAIFCSVFKLILSILFSTFNNLVVTNITSYIFALIIAITYGILVIKQRSSFQITISKPRNLHIELLISSFVAQFLVLLLMNGDTLIIKALIEDQNVVGIFTSGMVLCKIPMFLTTSLTTVLFPTVAAEKESNSDTFKTLIKSMSIGIVILIMTFIGIIVVGPTMIKILYGSSYIISREYLFFMALYVISLSVISYVQNYCIAIGETRSFNIFMILTIIIVVIFFNIITIDLQSILLIISIAMITVTLINLILIAKRR